MATSVSLDVKVVTVPIYPIYPLPDLPFWVRVQCFFSIILDAFIPDTWNKGIID